MSDDIVARLRVLNHHAKKLAENESLHDLYRDALTRCENLTGEAAVEIKRLREQLRLANIDNFNTTAEADRLRAERDEARRRVCENAIQHGRVYRRVGRDTVRCETVKEVAEIMGWDCFKEATDGK